MCAAERVGSASSACTTPRLLAKDVKHKRSLSDVTGTAERAIRLQQRSQVGRGDVHAGGHPAARGAPIGIVVAVLELLVGSLDL